MADVFGKDTQAIKLPITADKCVISWDGIIASATNFSLTYQQPINRRRTIGGKEAIIYTGQPQGNITISRLLVDGEFKEIFSKQGWVLCNEPADITIHLNGCEGDGGALRATGCLVSAYSLQGEADGLTVIDNINIEFLQLHSS